MLAAIDVGANAVRLEIANPLPDGTLEAIHLERDPIRPGEGVFTYGLVSEEVASRLLGTLRRYAALCRDHRARVRAVATSALREARNRDEIVERVREETGLELEVLSGREEARLICLGVLARRPRNARSLVLDVGGGSTEIGLGLGREPESLHSVAIGAVRLSEIFSASRKVSPERLAAMRSCAAEALRDQLPRRLTRCKIALGSSGTIRAIVAAGSRSRRLTRKRLEKTVRELAGMTLVERRRLFEPRRAEIIVAGAVILEAAVHHLDLEAVVAVDTGLRDGVLLDLARRTPPHLTTGSGPRGRIE